MTKPDLDRDDERFKNYLRQFQPLEPGALLSNVAMTKPRLWRLIAVWSVAAAMIAIVVCLLILRHPLRVQVVHEIPTAERRGPMQILTIASANALLADSPSAQAALDEATFHSQRTKSPKDKPSALAVLSKATERL
jgi:hypothetical protein